MGLNTLGIAHDFLARRVKKGGFCIDGTAGRGKDTAFLCRLVGDEGKVISFDIQKDAIDSTNALLQKEGLSHIAEVVLDSHANMDSYAEPGTVDAVVFNFGYLPGGDHSIHTVPESSIEALDKSLVLLKDGGVICACVYHGGDTGYEERDALMDYFASVDPKKYTVLVSDFRNRPGDPPIAVFIFKEI